MTGPCGLSTIRSSRQRLIDDLKQRFMIVIVTHNMQQAARVSGTTAFLLAGEPVEHTSTTAIFTNPSDRRASSDSWGRGD